MASARVPIASQRNGSRSAVLKVGIGDHINLSVRYRKREAKRTATTNLALRPDLAALSTLR